MGLLVPFRRIIDKIWLTKKTTVLIVVIEVKFLLSYQSAF